MMKEWFYRLGCKIVAKLRKFYGIQPISNEIFKNVGAGWESAFCGEYKKSSQGGGLTDEHTD